ncbi:hypothetical protein PSHT_04922 [Puccinia striiformis]|uniref:Uncharacterized protein n=1 Tax=Puccinia striiformis TaxID=27350 RepID=A0A2S4WBT1_9BASI|nr:hypothetical protein PSHT_04922 [Puccinia striiformis]
MHKHRLEEQEVNQNRPPNNQIPQINWRDYMEHELERIREDFALDDLDNVEEEEEDLEQWAPFKSKMDFVGCLLVGWYKRNLISRTLFDQIRLILNGLCQLKIPAWSTIHRSQKRIRDLLGLQIQMQESVWSTPGAALSSRRALQQDLSKPLVAPFFDFYPEYTKGVNQYKLSQSQKWLNMSPSLRTQMCANNTKHFYIFEPVETYSKHILVPIFIYTKDGERHAKCVIPTLKLTGPTTYQLEIQRHIDFNDPELLSIKTKEFDKEYIEIKQNNQLLSEICGNEMFEDIMATLNLQHNCHDGECLIEKTKVTEVERQDTDVEEYWRLTRLSYNQPTEEDIVTAMTGGHLAWKGHCQKTMPCKKKKVGKRMVHMTSDTEWGSSGEIS